MDYIFGEIANRPELPPLSWNPDSSSSVNPHMLLCGSSGAGKTTTLFDIVKYLNRKKKHIFIFDLKGDMVIKDGGEVIGNYIEFTAWDSQYGISPFEFDAGVTAEELNELIENNTQPTKEQMFKIKNSGPKVQVNRIIEIIKKNFLPNIGAGQRDIFMYLLSDTYKAAGFEYDKIETWSNELPSFSDTLYLIERIKSYIDNGVYVIDAKSEDFILNLNKKTINLKALKQREIAQKNGEDSATDDEIQELRRQIESIESDIDELVDEYVNESMNTLETSLVSENREWFDSRGIDIKKYATKDAYRTMVKMESYIKALVDAGVFHSKKPPVKAGLNIVNISGLDVDIQRFVVDIWLGKVFKSCKIRGTYTEMKNRSRGEKCDTFVIIDESKLVAGKGREKNDPYSYLNRIATEARSFGLGLVVAAQSAEHFPQEFLKNFYTQVILSTSVADFDTVRKSFGVEKQLLEFTQQGWGRALVKTGRVFQKVKLFAGREFNKET